MNRKEFKYVIGVDEAGRGPLAGPVAVGAVKMACQSGEPARATLAKFIGRATLPRLRDSKQLNEKQREIWFAVLKRAKLAGKLDFAVSLVSHRVIDKKGISFAIKLGIKRAISRLTVGQARLNLASKECRVLLDGGLKAPAEFINQKTIIRGDEKEPIISLASIVAKVTRDRHMARMAKKYPNYGFEKHKGYGTKKHLAAVRRQGVTPIHRTSFLHFLL